MNLKSNKFVVPQIARGAFFAIAAFAIAPVQAVDDVDHHTDPIDGGWIGGDHPDENGNCFAFTTRHAADGFHGAYATSIQWYRNGEQIGARLMLRWAPSQVVIGRYTPGTANILIPRGDGADFAISLTARASDGSVSNSGEFEMHTNRKSMTSGLVAYGDVPAEWLVKERHAIELGVVIGGRHLVVRRIQMDGYYQSWANTARCIGVN